VSDVSLEEQSASNSPGHDDSPGHSSLAVAGDAAVEFIGAGLRPAQSDRPALTLFQGHLDARRWDDQRVEGGPVICLDGAGSLVKRRLMTRVGVQYPGS
jgi:hypothetical protein